MSSAEIDQYDPADSTTDFYTERFHESPLWSSQDWYGAIENYDDLGEIMFPADPRRTKRDRLRSTGED